MMSNLLRFNYLSAVDKFVENNNCKFYILVYLWQLSCQEKKNF